jgi:hypothetical protein
MMSVLTFKGVACSECFFCLFPASELFLWISLLHMVKLLGLSFLVLYMLTEVFTFAECALLKRVLVMTHFFVQINLSRTNVKI